MGEEEKKVEEKKVEEVKAEEKPKKVEEEEKKEEAKEEKKEKSNEEAKVEETPKQPPPPPPPPQEIVLRVYMHCEGCARKVRKCLTGFPGVEDVMTDCKTHKVVVKGERADPLKVLARVQRKSHRRVELLSPIPPPPAEPKKPEEKEIPKPPEKKEPQVITVVLKVHMHCEACAEVIKKRIERMKGVEIADTDLKGSQVTVKGVFDPANLVEYVHKKTGKHAIVTKLEPEKKKEVKGNEATEEKKVDEGGEKEGKKTEEPAPEVPSKAGKEKKEDGGEKEDAKPGEVPAAATGEKDPKKEVMMETIKKNEFYYYFPPQNYQMYPPRAANEVYPPAPQMFSDENPNACSVM